MKISEFVSGQEITSFFIVKAINVKTSSNNKTYLDMTLSDISGEINAKHWDPQTEHFAFKVGDILKVRGTVTMWQGSGQLKIIQVRLVNDSDEYSIHDLIKTAPIPAEEMYSEITGFIRDISDLKLQELVEVIFSECKEKLMYYPAAKSNHHSIKSGLLYHLVRMLRTAKALSEVYPHLNRDLIYVGVLLHDIEKISEMLANEFGIVEKYTTEGQLLGHIIMGIKLVERVSEQIGLDKEKSLLVQHLILSHHYEPEFGSPVKPLIPEGEILHYIDIIDARIYDFDQVQTGLEVGAFSEPVFVLDKRRVYKPKL